MRRKHVLMTSWNFSRVAYLSKKFCCATYIASSLETLLGEIFDFTADYKSRTKKAKK
jgi:hypothetical protein